jgi:catechol 2,3-dioxygenase-like lactoylglutathione lyase family enzyme
MLISNLDHLVLTVRSIEKSCDFYTRILGMELNEFAGGRKALKFGNQKINLHKYQHEFEPKAAKPTPGSSDLCFLTETPLSEVVVQLEQQQLEIIEGPVKRTGANGAIVSIYIRDPDDNLIEIANSLS